MRGLQFTRLLHSCALLHHANLNAWGGGGVQHQSSSTIAAAEVSYKLLVVLIVLNSQAKYMYGTPYLGGKY